MSSILTTAQRTLKQLLKLAGSSDRRVLVAGSLMLVFLETLLCSTIINRIPYTEIDWKAYMQQVSLIEDKNERDYSLIAGDTGPLVYPGGHVLVFRLLYHFTDKGTDLLRAQHIFMALYLLTQVLVLWLYIKHRVPLYLLPLLILSKRLHSIYLLRLFNDCFATLFSIMAVISLDHGLLLLSSVLFSLAVSVKMNALLLLPGAAVIYYSNIRNIPKCIVSLGIPFVCVQLAVFQPFTQHWYSYLTCAFDFSRQFMYKWTVNWKFIPEQVFLSKKFANTLLTLHVTLLTVFLIHTCKIHRLLQKQVVVRLDTFKILALSNILGVLCARSLHYQFYSWFYWTVPYLLYRAKYHPMIAYGIWLLQEYAWNVFPATPISSAIAVTCLALLSVPNLWTDSS